MILTIKKPRRVEIYISSGRHSAKQVRELTGADVVINGGLYDMSRMAANCHLRVKGVDHASDAYNYVYGYGWNDNSGKIVPVESKNKAVYDNFICCSWMLTNGAAVKMIYNAAQGGSRGNTAIGRLPDGSIVVNVHRDIAAERCTPEEMQAEMLEYGCVDALRLDGGGSSQLSAGGYELSVSRKVHNYICIWGEKEETDLFKIALGAGHGANTAGKRVPAALDKNQTREWALNDRVCDKVEALLKNYDGCSLLRLDDSDDGSADVALSKRTASANSWGANLYLSVHHNAGASTGTGDWSGIVAYSYPGSAAGAEWRDAFYDALIESTGLSGNRWDGTLTANFQVLRDSNMPAVLLELGFMDSTVDAPVILTEAFADGCAEAIVEVIAEKAGLEKREGAVVIEPESPSGFAATACGRAVAKGLVLGDGEGGYGWKNPVTLEQVCVLLDRAGLLG